MNISHDISQPMTPPVGLRLLAEWFDMHDATVGAEGKEVQDHLRQWATDLEELARWREAARLTDEYTMHYVEPYPKPPFEGYISWLPGWSLYDVAHPPQASDTVTTDIPTTCAQCGADIKSAKPVIVEGKTVFPMAGVSMKDADRVAGFEFSPCGHRIGLFDATEET